MSRAEVHISADISGTGVEVRAADDEERRLVMIPPSELGLPDRLVFEIRSWQRWFDEVVYLLGLEGRIDALGDKFDEVGQTLAERVAAELGPAYRVVYGPQGGWGRRIGHGQAIVVQE